MQQNRLVWGLVLPIVVFWVHAWLYLDFFIDDAYISLRYVKQWLAGNGLVYNIGEPVEGYSNFLWVVLLGFSSMLGMDLIVATRIWGIGLSLATLVLVGLFVRRLPFSFFSPLFLAFSAPFAIWAVGGLENPLFMFLAFAGAQLFYREEMRGAGWASSIFWGLLALTRPDGLLFGAVAFFYRVARLYQLRSWPRSHDYLRGLVLAGILGVHLVWRLAYYGYPLPNTIYAKSMGLNLRAIFEGGHYIYTSFEVLGGFFLCSLLVLLALLVRQKVRYVAYFTANAIAYLLVIFLAGGDWMPAQRFLASVLPFLAVIFHVGAAELAGLLSPRLKRVPVAAFITAQLLYIAVIALNVRFIEPGALSGHRLSFSPPWVTYLEAQVQESDTIAVVDAGYVAYALPLTVRIVDMIGLVDAHIAHRPPQFPGGLWGRGDAWGRWDVDYVLAQKPRFVQVFGSFDEEGNWQSGFTGATLLVNDPRFREQYRLTEMRGIFELSTDAAGLSATSDTPATFDIYGTEEYKLFQ